MQVQNPTTTPNILDRTLYKFAQLQMYVYIYHCMYMLYRSMYSINICNYYYEHNCIFLLLFRYCRFREELFIGHHKLVKIVLSFQLLFNFGLLIVDRIQPLLITHIKIRIILLLRSNMRTSVSIHIHVQSVHIHDDVKIMMC